MTALIMPTQALVGPGLLSGAERHILYAVPTSRNREGTPHAVEAFGNPPHEKVDILQVWYAGEATKADARNLAVTEALRRRKAVLMLVDADVRPPPMALIDLPRQAGRERRVIASVRCMTGPWRLRANWGAGTVAGVDFGCVAIPVELFAQMRGPWFTSNDGADQRFQRRAERLGYRFVLNDRLLAGVGGV